MQNKETLQTTIDCYDHHTRLSGYATNTNTQNTGERYVATNLRVDHIADELDSYAMAAGGSTGTIIPGFAGSNVEGVVGTFVYTDCHFNTARGSHVNLVIPYSGSAGVYTMPGRTIITVNGFTTDDTAMGGLFRLGGQGIGTQAQPYPQYAGLQADLIGFATTYYNIRKIKDGPRLLPVKASVYNANPSAYSPTTHYILSNL